MGGLHKDSELPVVKILSDLCKGEASMEGADETIFDALRSAREQAERMLE